MAKIYKKGGPKDITKEFHLKTEENSTEGGDIGFTYLMGGVRTAMFNVIDNHPDLNPVSLSFILFINQFKFVSRVHIRNQCRAGFRGVYNHIPLLLDYGYIEHYSPKQPAYVFEHRYVEGMGSYQHGVEKTISSKLILTKKGKKVVREFEEMLRPTIDEKKPVRANPISKQIHEKAFGKG